MQVEKIRHELHFRTLTVQRVEFVTPRMLRLWLAGPELAGFTSLGADDHIKVFAPDGEAEAMRDYTPRRFDAAAQALAVDFALHEAGPVTAWALAARPGDAARIGGPRGSTVISGVSDWLLIGDETALPAIGRRIEEMAPGTRVTSLVAVTGAAEAQAFATEAQHRPLWVHRPASAADDAEPLLAALAGLNIAPQGFVWIAAEASVARALRAAVLARGHAPERVKSSGYWLRGQADSSEKG